EQRAAVERIAIRAGPRVAHEKMPGHTDRLDRYIDASTDLDDDDREADRYPRSRAHCRAARSARTSTSASPRTNAPDTRPRAHRARPARRRRRPAGAR